MKTPVEMPIFLDEPRRLTPVSAWHEHIPFAMFLVEVLRPETIVELGTHWGDSYCAFCQAVETLKLKARCFAVDTWKGDAHAGFYGSEVLEDLRAHHDPLYGGFSRLIQSTFDEALAHFADGIVELLHIDGCHTYEAVKHDFESWLPKLNRYSVVLFHDTNVREREFGVWRFWSEVKQSYPHFEFVHGHGIGVLGVGKDQPRRLRDLYESSDEATAKTREYFFHLGHRLVVRAQSEAEKESLRRQVSEKAQTIQTLSSDLQKSSQVTQILSSQVGQKESAIQDLSSHLAQKDEMLRTLSAQVGQKESAVQELRTSLAQRQQAQRQQESLLAARDGELQRLTSRLAKQTEESGQVVENIKKQLSLTAEAHRQSQEYIGGLKQHLANIEGSLGWRLIVGFRSYRDRLMPQGTTRRATADRILRTVKHLYVEGLSGLTRPASPMLAEEGPLLISCEGRKKYEAQPADYQRWIQENELGEEQLAQQRELASKLARRPLISIVMPTWNPLFEIFRDTLRSVTEQTYDNWELCIAGGSSDRPELMNELGGISRTDARFHVKVLKKNLGISGNSNEALKLARGEFIALLDHDDILAPSALYEVATLLDRSPELDFIYTDKDLLTADGQTRVEPLFKPNWSPEIMLSANYLTHLCVIRRELIEKVGGFDAELDGAQDWDLFLRVLEKTDRVAHIPQVLYHWRAVPTSAASGIQAKPYALGRQLKSVQSHLRRRGTEATASLASSGFMRVTWPIRGHSRVSIIIPNQDRMHLLRRCLETLSEKTAYKNFEVLIVENGSQESATFRFYDELKENKRVRILTFPKPFNYSAVNNFGVEHASGDVLLFLNNDTEIMHSDWLEEMVRWIERNEVGVVGAKLLKEDGTIQHAGVILGLTGFAGHVFAGLTEGHWGLFGSTEWYRNYLAVTGACLMVRREVFQEVGGFREGFRCCGSDVEFCLRVRQRGYRIVYTPFAKLIHHEAATRRESVPQDDFQVSFPYYEPFLRKGDPYFNSNLSYWHTIPQLRMRKEQSPLEFASNFIRAIPGVPIENRAGECAQNLSSLWGRYSSDAMILAPAYDFTENDLLSNFRANSDVDHFDSFRSINWFLPSFQHAYYGGIYTILRFAAYFKQRKQVQNRFVIIAPNSLDSIAAALGAAFPELREQPVLGVSSQDELAQIPEADACVATFWTTAYWVLKFNRTRKKFYFIQDWESFFYPAGSTSIQVEATYLFGFYAIANTKTMRDMYERQFAGKGEFFNPCVDTSIFYPDATQKNKTPTKVFFYGRPEHPRNGFELGIACLRKVKERFGDQVDIIAAGAPWDPKDYSAEDIVDNLGLLPYEETAKLYRSCDIGLALMFTRHPSYIPLELMASGCVVVSNSNPATAWLMQDGVNCILSKPSASCLSEAVGRAILDTGIRQILRENALTIIRKNYSNWSAEIQKIYEFMCQPERA